MKVSEISAPQVHDLLPVGGRSPQSSSCWSDLGRSSGRRAKRTLGWVLQRDPNKEDSSAGGVAGSKPDLSTSSSAPCIAGRAGGHRKVARPQLAVGTLGQRRI